MFQNSYQNGHYFEVFDPKVSQDKSKNVYKMQNVSANNKIFEKNLKTFIFQFNQSNSRMILPKEDKKQLYLIQQYLNLQIWFSSTIDWNIQLTVSDLTRTKRRIIISPSVHKIQRKPFFVKFPCPIIKQGIWMNFCIDLYSFIQAFKGQTYRSLDMIQISGNFKLRRIYTTQNLIPQLSHQQQNSINLLPKNLSFPPQVVNENLLVLFENDLHLEQQHAQVSSKNGSHLVSSKSIKKQIMSKKSIKQIKQPVSQQCHTSAKQVKTVKKIQQKKEIQNSHKGYINEKKFLANTNGLQIIRTKKQLNQNSDNINEQTEDVYVKTPMSTNKNTKKTQPLAKTQNPKLKPSLQKRNSIKQNQQKLKSKIHQKQKLNPWKSSNKKINETDRCDAELMKDERKVQSAQASLFKTKNNLVERMNDSKNRFERKSDCYSDSEYVQLSQKFSTVTEGRFFKNQLSSKNVELQKLDNQKSHDEIQQNIQIQANSFYEKSNKKEQKQFVQLQLKQRPIQQSINDSLDVYKQKKSGVMNNQSYMNMSSRLGFGQKMMNKYMKQLERPYSPPLGERQHTQDHESGCGYQQDKQVQLMYDPVLNCYYDHKTHTYYELKN